MSTVATKKVVSAWRDEDYFETLSSDERAALPASPVGKVQLKLVQSPNKDIRASNTSVFESTHCSTSAFDCCGTSVFNTCSTSVFDCCK